MTLRADAELQPATIIRSKARKSFTARSIARRTTAIEVAEGADSVPRLPQLHRASTLEHFAHGRAPVHAGGDALVMVKALLVADLVGELELPLAGQPPALRTCERDVPDRAELNFVGEMVSGIL